MHPEYNKTHMLKYGRNKITFKILYSSIQNLSISVDPNLSVLVKAPEGTSLETINQRLQKRAFWIQKKLEYFEQFHPVQPLRKYVSGETHRYLGRQYRLKIIESDHHDVKLKGKFIWIFIKEVDDKLKIENLLEKWYRTNAERVFLNVLEEFFKLLKEYSIPYPRLIIRKMRKRWGSCTKKGDIQLNLELVKVSRYYIEYVVMHELCHLIEPRHNNKFYDLLITFMPDWEMRKKKLELAQV